MKRPETIQAYLKKSIFSYAGVGFFILLLVSAALSFLLSRAQMASDLEKSAQAVVEAFQDRIVDGDVRSVEPQIAHILQLKDSESAQILNSNLTRAYESFQHEPAVKPCAVVGETCFNGLFGAARIIYPITLDSNASKPFGYLYLSKNVRFNWSEWMTVFAVFSLGYIGLMVCFFRFSNVAVGKLGDEIKIWSSRLRSNAKSAAPLDNPPFAELLTLKSAIEGLHI